MSQKEHAGGFSTGQQVLAFAGIKSALTGSYALFDALAISVSVKSRSIHLPSTSTLAYVRCFGVCIIGIERVELSSIYIRSFLYDGPKIIRNYTHEGSVIHFQ